MTGDNDRPTATRPPRKGLGSVRWGRVTGGFSLLIITAGGIGHALVDRVDRSIQRVDAIVRPAERPTGTRGTGGAGATSSAPDTRGKNFLLVGTDGRDSLTRTQRKRFHLGGAPCHCTDTIMLVHLSADRSRVSVVSIPRDSYAELPEHEMPFGGKRHAPHPDKINAAYAHGGPKLTVRTVEKLTGVRVDHYLEVNFTSFMKTVDILGGVQVCTARRLQDTNTGLDLPAGTSTLSGGQALQYVRSRHIDSAADLGRMRRQQRFLAQLVDRATSAGLLANPIKLARFASAVLGSVRVDQDLKTSDLLELARGLRSFSPGSSEFASVPVADSDYKVKGIGSTVRWDRAKARKLWAAIREDRPLAVHHATPAGHRAAIVEVDPARIRVQVDNGTSTPGAGKRADAALRATGFATTRAPGNAPGRGQRRTIIRYDPLWDRSARSLAAALPGAELKPVDGRGATMQVVIGANDKGVRSVRPENPDAADTSRAVTGDRVVCG